MKIRRLRVATSAHGAAFARQARGEGITRGLVAALPGLRRPPRLLSREPEPRRPSVRPTRFRSLESARTGHAGQPAQTKRRSGDFSNGRRLDALAILCGDGISLGDKYRQRRSPPLGGGPDGIWSEASTTATSSSSNWESPRALICTSPSLIVYGTGITRLAPVAVDSRRLDSPGRSCVHRPEWHGALPAPPRRRHLRGVPDRDEPPP
jgi:hypothetical protein